MFNSGDYSKVNEILHEDYSSGGGRVKGIEAQKQRRDYFMSAVPDGHLEILEMIAEGDKIAIWQEVKGTFTGELGNVKGKRQLIARILVSIYEFKDGKIISAGRREVMDNLSFFQQLGALSTTEEIVKAYNDSLK